MEAKSAVKMLNARPMVAGYSFTREGTEGEKQEVPARHLSAFSLATHGPTRSLGIRREGSRASWTWTGFCTEVPSGNPRRTRDALRRPAVERRSSRMSSHDGREVLPARLGPRSVSVEACPAGQTRPPSVEIFQLGKAEEVRLSEALKRMKWSRGLHEHKWTFHSRAQFLLRDRNMAKQFSFPQLRLRSVISKVNLGCRRCRSKPSRRTVPNGT